MDLAQNRMASHRMASGLTSHHIVMRYTSTYVRLIWMRTAVLHFHCLSDLPPQQSTTVRHPLKSLEKYGDPRQCHPVIVPVTHWWFHSLFTQKCFYCWQVFSIALHYELWSGHVIKRIQLKFWWFHSIFSRIKGKSALFLDSRGKAC